MADDESLLGGFRRDIRLALARAEAGDHPASRAKDTRRAVHVCVHEDMDHGAVGGIRGIRRITRGDGPVKDQDAVRRRVQGLCRKGGRIAAMAVIGAKLPRLQVTICPGTQLGSVRTPSLVRVCFRIGRARPAADKKQVPAGS